MELEVALMQACTTVDLAVQHKINRINEILNFREHILKEQFKARGVFLTSRCRLCHSHREDVQHLFLSCAMASALWDLESPQLHNLFLAAIAEVILKR